MDSIYREQWPYLSPTLELWSWLNALQWYDRSEPRRYVVDLPDEHPLVRGTADGDDDRSYEGDIRG